MKINLNEMETLYAFGCTNRKATILRLRELAALAPNPAAKKCFTRLAIKLYDKSDDWFVGFYYDVRICMEGYYRSKAEMEEVMNPDEEDEDGEADEV